jgi:predicted Zn-dependent peptidase
VAPPFKLGEDPEIRALLKGYIGAKNSNPPPPNSNELETKLVAMLVSKMESFERTRQDLADKLGASIRDSGTFTQFGQDHLDNMMLRAENTRLERENNELKDIIKAWTNRKNDWTVRLIAGGVIAALAWAWSIFAALRSGGNR